MHDRRSKNPHSQEWLCYLNRSRHYINFGREGSVDRAFVCDLQQLGSLFVRQRPCKMNVAFDMIEHSSLVSQSAQSAA